MAWCRHQAITWTKAYLPPKDVYAIRLRAIPQIMFNMLIDKIDLKLSLS